MLRKKWYQCKPLPRSRHLCPLRSPVTRLKHDKHSFKLLYRAQSQWVFVRRFPPWLMYRSSRWKQNWIVHAWSTFLQSAQSQLAFQQNWDLRVQKAWCISQIRLQQFTICRLKRKWFNCLWIIQRIHVNWHSLLKQFRNCYFNSIALYYSWWNWLY